MSQRDALRALYADLHAALGDFGELGNYLPPAAAPGAVVTVCRVCVDRGVQTYGEYGQVVGRRDVVTFLRVDVSPVQKGTVVIDGVTYTLSELLAEDDGISKWAVRP